MSQVRIIEERGQVKVGDETYVHEVNSDEFVDVTPDRAGRICIEVGGKKVKVMAGFLKEAIRESEEAMSDLNIVSLKVFRNASEDHEGGTKLYVSVGSVVRPATAIRRIDGGIILGDEI